VIREVQGRGLAIEGGKVSLEGCLLSACTSGVEVTGGAKARIARTTLAGNARALVVDPPRVVVRSTPRRPPVAAGPRRPLPPPSPGEDIVTVAGEAASAVEATDCVFGPNLEHIAASDASRLSVSATLFAPGGLRDPVAPRGEGVVVASPRFAAPHKGDFRLAKGSPGQGKGPGGADLGWAGPPAR
jgi:hypothetical protein